MIEPKPHKVVARYLDGRVMKGYSDDFDPDSPRFHLLPADQPMGEGLDVFVKDLKALFFVRSFSGNREHTERRDFSEESPLGFHKVMVEFLDGELVAGYTTGYNPQRPGFFLVPVDPGSNNLRVFAALAAVKSVRLVSW